MKAIMIPKVLSILLILSISLTACTKEYGPKENAGTELHASAEAKTELYESEQALDDWASVIVRVERTEEEKNEVKKLDASGHFHGWTIANVKVIEVLKDISGNDVKDGDEIPVYEQQFTYYDKKKDANITWHVNQYQMMIPGNEYILYLNYSENDEWYYMAGGIFGKINVSAEEPLLFEASQLNLDEAQQEIDDSEMRELLKKLREESLEKYTGR